MRASREGFVWIVNVTTGLMLVVLLPIHLFLTHVGLNELSFDSVSARLALVSVKAFYLITIVALLVHGWTGFRGILLDLKPSKGQIAVINVGIVAIASATLVYSIYIVLAIS